MTSKDTFPGEEFRARYRLEERLGEGAMGVVWAARDLSLDRPVAAKFLRGDGLDESRIARFFEEARSLARIDHPHILKVLDMGDAAGAPFIVFERLHGEELASLLAREAPLELARALALFDDLAEAMEAAHREGILHRDLKPSNLMVTDEGLRVMDFGLARRIDRGDRITATGMILGTPAYLSPEQARGEEAGRAADLYSAGVCLFEMLTGRLPFETDDLGALLAAHASRRAPDPRMFRPDLPPALGPFFARALHKDPARRHPSFSAMRTALRGAVEAPEGEDPSASSGTVILPRGARREGARRRPREAEDGRGPGRTVAMSGGVPVVPARPTVARLVVSFLALVFVLLAAWTSTRRGGDDMTGVAESLRIEPGVGSCRIVWRSVEANATRYEIRLDGPSRKLVLRGRESSAVLVHELAFRSLRRDTVYRLVLGEGKDRIERVFRTEALRLTRPVAFAVLGDAIHLDLASNFEGEHRLVVEEEGGLPLGETVGTPGPDGLLWRGLPPEGTCRWTLHGGGEILASASFRSWSRPRAPLLRRWNEDELVLPRPAAPPVVRGDRVFVADDAGALTCHRRRRVRGTMDGVMDPLEVEWVFVAPGQRPPRKGERQLGGLTLLEDGRVFCSARLDGGRRSFFCLDPELRGSTWLRRGGGEAPRTLPTWVVDAGDPWCRPLGEREFLVEGTGDFTPLETGIVGEGRVRFTGWDSRGRVGWGSFALATRAFREDPAPTDVLLPGFVRWEKPALVDRRASVLRTAYSYELEGERRRFGLALLVGRIAEDGETVGSRLIPVEDVFVQNRRDLLGRGTDGILRSSGARGFHEWDGHGRPVAVHRTSFPGPGEVGHTASAPVHWTEGRWIHVVARLGGERAGEMERRLGAEVGVMEAHELEYELLLVDRDARGREHRWEPALAVDRGRRDYLTVDHLLLRDGCLLGITNTRLFVVDLEARRFMNGRPGEVKLDGLASGEDGLVAIADDDARVAAYPLAMLRGMMDRRIR